MLRQFSIASARNQLPALIHEVESGPAVELTRRGKPVAVLLSVDEYSRLRPEKADFWQAILKFREDNDLEELQCEEVWSDVRSHSTGREPDF